MTITKLNINNNALNLQDKYPFLVGEAYTQSLETGEILQITINYLTQSLQYSLYNLNSECVLYRASLQEYPFNLSLRDDRVLYLANNYIIDSDLSHDLAKSLQNEISQDELLALIQKAQSYAGD